MAILGVRKGLEMIVSHRAPSSLNMSSYRAIWTHFRSNSVIIIDLILQKLLICTSNFRQMDTQPSGRWKKFLANGCSTLRKAEDFMPRDIMSSEPRHWMVFGQLVMPVQCCAGARRRQRVPQHRKYHPVPWLRCHNVSWHHVFCFPEGVGTVQEFGPSSVDMSWTRRCIKQKLFQETNPKSCDMSSTKTVHVSMIHHSRIESISS